MNDRPATGSSLLSDLLTVWGTFYTVINNQTIGGTFVRQQRIFFFQLCISSSSSDPIENYFSKNVFGTLFPSTRVSLCGSSLLFPQVKRFPAQLSLPPPGQLPAYVYIRAPRLPNGWLPDCWFNPSGPVSGQACCQCCVQRVICSLVFLLLPRDLLLSSSPLRYHSSDSLLLLLPASSSPILFSSLPSFPHSTTRYLEPQ